MKLVCFLGGAQWLVPACYGARKCLLWSYQYTRDFLYTCPFKWSKYEQETLHMVSFKVLVILWRLSIPSRWAVDVEQVYNGSCSANLSYKFMYIKSILKCMTGGSSLEAHPDSIPFLNAIDVAENLDILWNFGTQTYVLWIFPCCTSENFFFKLFVALSFICKICQPLFLLSFSDGRFSFSLQIGSLGALWYNGSTLSLHPRGPGFDSQVEGKIWLVQR